MFTLLTVRSKACWEIEYALTHSVNACIYVYIHSHLYGNIYEQYILNKGSDIMNIRFIFVLISKYICMYQYIAIYCQCIYCCILKNISTSFQYMEMYYVIYHYILQYIPIYFCFVRVSFLVIMKTLSSLMCSIRVGAKVQVSGSRGPELLILGLDGLPA